MKGKKYRHYKGGIYQVICIAKCSETLQDRVIYKDGMGVIWDRPLSMWEEEVNGKPRFEEIK